MKTIQSALTFCIAPLEKAGIENARFEARLLLCHVLDVETQILIGYPEREVTDDQLLKLETLLKRRLSREPMSHILGEREFWSLSFIVTKDTLTPRPDSETLIESVLTHFPETGQTLRVLDLGTGTGCLLLSTLSEYKNATGLGVDISPEALHVAKENAQSLGFSKQSEFKLGNWAEGIDEKFDLILSNPPYIPDRDRADLEPEVKDHEPDTALFAGIDGLDDYKRLSNVLPGLLNDAGKAVIELGIGQAEDVTNLMNTAGLMVVDQAKDLGGVIRCLIIQKKL